MSELIRILVVDDSEADADLIKDQLRRDGIINAYYQRVDTAEDLIRALPEHNWDIALCDYIMPEFSGLEALKLIRESLPDMPCIIVSGQIGEEVAVAAMKAGASDYIMKDKLKRLAPAIKREIQESRSRLEKKRIQKALEDKEEELRVIREIERAKDEFIGFVSHELRTPLTVVIGALHTFLTTAGLLSEEEKMQLVSDAFSEAEGLADIVENLLYLARDQANRLKIARENVDPSKIISDVLQKIKARTTEHQFIMDCSSSIRIHADPVAVKVILHNLIHNAVKYSPPGEVRVIVQRKDSMAQIAVCDKGAGISEEDQMKIFQPFERLSAPSRQVKGIGLGLLVCQRLVEAQGGRIWLESRPGEGSTFYFTLPLAKDFSPEAAAAG